MTDNQKYLLLAGVGAAGVAYWYFYYGPGATTTTTTTAAASPSTASVVPLPANGSTVPLPAIVQSFLNSLGPVAQARWATVVPQLTASSVSTFYQQLAAIIPYWSAGAAPPASLQTPVDSWFTSNGFGDLTK